MLKQYTLLLASLLTLLVACTSSITPEVDPTTPTALESFGANPNPAPANIPVIFSWSVTGDGLTCAVDVDNNGTNEYTVQNCSSSSRASHVYGVQGSFTAQLTVTGADGVTQKKTTPVVLAVENQAPSVLSFDVRQGSKENSLIFAWVVSDSGADTLSCRLDADGDGQWESDRLCSATQQLGQVNGLATSSNQVEITLPTGSYNSIFEVYDAYSTTRISSKSRSPYNRLPQISTFTTTASDKLRGTVAFKVTDPDRDEMICSLTVQGVGQFVFKNCSTITRSYTFPKEGTYKVTLEVIDEYEGVASTAAEFTFQAPPLQIVPLASGALHTCSLLSNGTAYCWGENNKGQLGAGDEVNQSNPTAVSIPSGVLFAQLVAGGYYTCGLSTDGAAYCWGENNAGQLGNDDFFAQNTPQAVSMPSGVTFTQLTAGNYHICGLTAAGAAHCWGMNNFGQLGIGSTTNQRTPQAITMPSGVTFTQLNAGAFHICGLTAAGAAYCWGRNVEGQLGIGNTDNQNTPQAVTLPPGPFTQLTAGLYHTCGLTAAGAAYCWGENNKGQLGNSTFGDSYVPVAVSMPSGVTFAQLTAASVHSCGLTAAGATYCWGSNDSGQLGTGATTTSHNTPQAVSMPSGVSFALLDAGDSHTCGRTAAAAIYCWGYNEKGQLGVGTTTNHNTPQPVSIP